ncbi:hypothetical protein [Pseudomonas fluorescens]|uniref:hypothetical protein n=1 Tax=Pseudomonas fluorescens TaxID=294 RepID=UPI0009367530|nr:hypothetical protein [Pseudomonas fluorescens]
MLAAIENIEVGIEGQRNVKFQQARQFLEPAGYFSGGLLAAGYDPHEKITVTFNSYVGRGSPDTLTDSSTRTYFAWEIAAGALAHDKVERGGPINFQSMRIEQKDRSKVADLESAGRNLQDHWESEISSAMRSPSGDLAQRSGKADAYVIRGTLQSLVNDKDSWALMSSDTKTTIQRVLQQNGQIIIPNLYGYPLAGYAFIPTPPYDGNPANRPNKGIMIDLKNGTVSELGGDQDFNNWARSNRDQLLSSFNARDRQGGKDEHWPKAGELLDNYIAGNVGTYPGYRSVVSDKRVPVWETFNYSESRGRDYRLKYGNLDSIAEHYQAVNANNAVWDDQTEVFGSSQQNWKNAKELWSHTFGYIPGVGNAGNIVFGVHDALYGMTADDRVGGDAAAVISSLQLVHELATSAAGGGESELGSDITNRVKWSNKSLENDFELVRTPTVSTVTVESPPGPLAGMREVEFRGRKYIVADKPDAGDGVHYLLRSRDLNDPEKLVSSGKLAKPDANGVWRARGIAGGNNGPVFLKERIAGTTLERPATAEQILELNRKPGSDYTVSSLDPNDTRPFKPDGSYAFVIRAQEPDKVYVGSMNKGLTPEGKRYPYVRQSNPDWVGGHSALTSGLKSLKGGTTDVLFAGEVYIKNGNIEFWTNGSGHYQPPTELRDTNLTPIVKELLPNDRYVEEDQLTRAQEQMWSKSTHMTPQELAETEEWLKEEFNIQDTEFDNEISDDE